MSHPYDSQPGAAGDPNRAGGYPGQSSEGYGQSSDGYGQSSQGYGQPSPNYGDSAPEQYGQGQSGYGQSAPNYGQSAPSYGQSSPDYGQSSANQAQQAPAYGQDQSAQGFPGSGYSTGGPAYPNGVSPKKRGLKRIIFGSILFILGIPAMFIGGTIGLVAGTLAGISGATPTPLTEGTPFSVTQGIYFIAVPKADASSSACTVKGEPASAISADPDDSGTFTVTKGNTEYVVVQQVTADSSAQLTVNCENADDVVAAPMEYGAMGWGTALGVGIPALFTLLGLALLISGIVGRVRSGRQKA